MRDRLIELLKGAETKVAEKLSHLLALEEWISIYADHLLANGVVVPPCKVGDKLYKPWTAGGRNVVAEFVVVAIISAIKDEYFIKYKKIGGTISYQVNISNVGKTVFLSRKEAEKKLKEGAEE